MQQQILAATLRAMAIPIGQTGSGALQTNRMWSIEQLVSLQLFTQSTGLRDDGSGAAQLAKKQLRQ
jgi:hypothetical protein